MMNISPDQAVFWHWGYLHLNETILATWGIMLLLTMGSWLVTHRLSSGKPRSRWQNILEIIVIKINEQIKEAEVEKPGEYLGFLGTLFLFIAAANTLTILPFYEPPTGSLSTTLALALCVFVAVPAFGIRARGWSDYLRSYSEPSVIMIPFNIISEVSRTAAMAIRLFGNMMSGTMIIAILLVIAPLIFPIFMTALGLLIGLVQAYVFGILALVYIAAAVQVTKS